MTKSELMAAYAAGVVGASAMSLTANAARRAGLHLDLEMLMGTMLGFAPGARARRIGLFAQLVTGGVFACGYRLIWDALRIPIRPSSGALFGAAHGIAAGAALAVTPSMHPQVPEGVDPPGPFMLNAGRSDAAVFLGMHVLFGMVVGFLVSKQSGRRR